jgi:HlyD family secretion protein/epimerase transport system membrane fusion protein
MSTSVVVQSTDLPDIGARLHPQNNLEQVSASQWGSRAALLKSIRGPARLGVNIIVLFLVTFFVFAGLVPLSGGAMAPGIISPDGSRKVVQHLEGGIIQELRVKDGDQVKAGQVLVVLDSTQQSANYEALKSELVTLRAKKSRLLAERANATTMSLVDAENDASSTSAYEAQKLIFDSRREATLNKKEVLNLRIRQLEEQVRGLRAQLVSARQQHALIKEELDAKGGLEQKGLIAKPEILRLRRVETDIAGREGEYVANIAQVMQRIGETRMELLSVDKDRMERIDGEFDKARADLVQIEERARAAKDMLRRTEVVAPVDGKIVNLRFKTKGGIIQKGEPILEIVPTNDALLIEARVTPVDARLVRQGLSALIHFSAYPSRTAPRISGVVQSISADRLSDPATHQPYYLARVEVNREELSRRAPNVEMIPGMPADILIVTEHRTLLEILSKPFKDALHKSFREI